MKVIPVYLPQFHTISENDEWWGKGFTEWTNVKNARPLFEGHNQPRIPLDNNYYDLSKVETLRWQCKLAKEHGIYGFAMYHYWFNGHLLLEKPMEMLLANPDIDINYCISWANHDWNDSWKAVDGKVRTLIYHDFDDENDWVEHFNYMLPFFKDKRYMTEDGMPLLIIYVPQLIRKISKMLDLWEQMARDNGFPGIKFIYQNVSAWIDKTWDRSRFSYGIEFQPDFIRRMSNNKVKAYMDNFVIKNSRRIKQVLNINRALMPIKKTVTLADYDEDWRKILNWRPKIKNAIPSAMVDWDNTPRRKGGGWVYANASPEKFKKYFKQLILNAKQYYKTDKVFVFAWNEWAEGGYLEPDTLHHFAYLKAIKEVLEETKL